MQANEALSEVAQPPARSRPVRMAAVASAIALIGIYFAGLCEHGYTYDEPENLLSGQVNLLLRIGHASGLSPDLDGPAFYERHYPPEHPHFAFPVSDLDLSIVPPGGSIWAALSCEVLYKALGVLPPLPAFHLATVLMALALGAAMYFFLRPVYGPIPAMLGAAAVLLHPRFYADAQFNVKDLPLTLYYALALLVWRSFLECPHRAPAKAFLFSAFTALGLLTKPTIAFAGITCALFAAYWALGRRRAALPILEMRFCWLLLLPPIVGAVVWLLWPLAMAAPAEVLPKYIAYVRDQGIVENPAWKFGQIRYLLWTTPPAFLALAVLGIVAIAAGRFRDSLGVLALLWLGVTCLRASWPTLFTYDGIRQVLEVLPALGILAAAGCAAIARLLQDPRAPRHAATALAAACVLALAWPLAATWPYSITYYNAIPGGLKGAQAISAEDFGYVHFRHQAIDLRRRQTLHKPGDYWGAGLVHVARWLNTNAEPSAEVLTQPGYLFQLMVYDGLRPDIRAFERPTERPLYILQYPPFEETVPIDYASLELAAEATRQGGIIWRLWRVPPANSGS